MKKWRYITDENADEKGAGGIWDLSGEIVDEIQSASEINADVLQDLVYHKLRDYADETAGAVRRGEGGNKYSCPVYQVPTQKVKPIVTNFEYIQNMSIEDMAAFLTSIHVENTKSGTKYIAGHEFSDYTAASIFKWLESEVDDNG